MQCNKIEEHSHYLFECSSEMKTLQPEKKKS